MRRMLMIAATCLLGGCTTLGAGGLPETPGAVASNYGYVPLDPLPVDDQGMCLRAMWAEDREKWELVPALMSFPDLAIRFAVAELSGGGGLTFGPSKVTTKGSAYRAVLDYVNADVIPVEFLLRKLVQYNNNDEPVWKLPSVPINSDPGFKGRLLRRDGLRVKAWEAHIWAIAGKRVEDPNPVTPELFERVTFPIYVGVGLRLSADIRALEGNVNLSGLGAIGASAEAKRLAGTLTVQTLGITGRTIATALPLPSKLDQTTIENGILAIGTSRAVLYNTGPELDLKTTPRVVGLYSPINTDPMLINAIYSELSRQSLPFDRACRLKATTPASEGKPRG